MPSISGRISKEDVEAYGGANIMLLDGANDVTSSGGTISGSGTYEWTITWDSAGFTGNTWNAWGTNYEQFFDNGTLGNEIRNYGYYIASSLSGDRQNVIDGCVSLVTT